MPSRLFISENPATNTVFYVINIEKIPTFPKKNEILTIVAKSDILKIPLTLSLEMISYYQHLLHIQISVQRW